MVPFTREASTPGIPPRVPGTEARPYMPINEEEQE